MKLNINKILKISVILIVTVSLILFVASVVLQDKVADIVLNSLNRNVSTKIESGSFRLSFLKRFPKASLELKNVLIHSSKDFNSASFGGRNTDTLLFARFVSVEFSISDAIRGVYDIERIGAKEGILNLYSDKAGRVNYEISAPDYKKEEEDFSINLEKIYLTDIESHYNNLATKLIINGSIKNGQIKSRISGNDIDFSTEADLEIRSFKLYNVHITRTINAGLDLSIKSNSKGVLFRKGTLKIENYDFTLDGFISSDDILDLNVTGNNVDISSVKSYMPEKYYDYISKYDPSGILIINSKIKGKLSRTSNPHIEINCILNKGRITYGKSDLGVDNLSFAGHFTNGSRNSPETSSVGIRDLKISLGSADYTGSFSMAGLNDPLVNLKFTGRLFPGELKEFFDLNDITSAGGSADLELRLKNAKWPGNNFTLDSFIDLKPEADILFNSLNLGFKNDSVLFKEVKGLVELSDALRTTDLQLNYNGQKINVSGEFRNLPEWISGRAVYLIAKADVSFNRLIPELYLKNTSEESSDHKTAFTLPDDLMLDVKFKIDSLNYKRFSSVKISGAINYKPRLLTFNSLKIGSLNGVISGNGYIAQNSDLSFVSKSNFTFSSLDIKKAFTTFNNFGQDFIRAEHLSGTLSGSLALLLPMDSLLNPDIKSITAEGKYVVVDGELTNFDPVKELSDFIELSELQDISFERMENDFFIRSNYLYIPQMDVRSSAADLLVNGKHGFDNQYEYHVKMRLSEILSKKRKKKESNFSEFGVVEDDGLGRTSILLKIETKGEEIKVSYDMKAATSSVKNNIKSERESLKTILNQEYGWYKGDTSVKQQPVQKKPRFRISWEESDTVKSGAGTSSTKKEGGVSSLFKKK